MAKKAQDTVKSTKTDLRVKRKRKNTAIENKRVAEILNELSNFNLEKVPEEVKKQEKPNVRTSKKEPKVLDKIEGFDEIDFLQSETPEDEQPEVIENQEDVETEVVQEVEPETTATVEVEEMVDTDEDTKEDVEPVEVDSTTDSVNDAKNEPYPPVEKKKRTIKCPKASKPVKKEHKNNSLPVSRRGIIKGTQQQDGQIIIRPKRTLHLGLRKHEEVKKAKVVDVSINQNSPFFYEPSVFEKFNIRISDVDHIDDVEEEKIDVEPENQKTDLVEEVVNEVVEEAAAESEQQVADSIDQVEQQEEVISADDFLKDFEEDDFKELFGESLDIEAIEKEIDEDKIEGTDELVDEIDDEDVLDSQISGDVIDFNQTSDVNSDDDGEEDDIEFDSLEDDEKFREAADSISPTSDDSAFSKITSAVSKISIPGIFKKFTFEDAAIATSESVEDSEDMIINTISHADKNTPTEVQSNLDAPIVDDITNAVVNAEPVATVAEPIIEDISINNVEMDDTVLPTNIITPSASDDDLLLDDDEVEEIIKNNEKKTRRRKLEKRDKIIEDELEPIFPTNDSDVEEESSGFDIEKYFGIDSEPEVEQKDNVPENSADQAEEENKEETLSNQAEEVEEINPDDLSLDDFDIEDFENSLLENNSSNEDTSDETAVEEIAKVEDQVSEEPEVNEELENQLSEEQEVNEEPEDQISEEQEISEEPENQVEVSDDLLDGIDINDISLEDLELNENDLEGSLLDEHLEDANQAEVETPEEPEKDEDNIQDMLSKALLDDDSALNDDLKEELLSEVLSFESPTSSDEPSEGTKAVYTELENSVDKTVDHDEVVYKDPTSDFVKIIDSLTKTITELEKTPDVVVPESDDSGKAINILINKDDVFSISIQNESYEIVADFDGISVLSENIHISTPKNNFFVYVDDKYIEIHKQINHFELTTNFEDIEFANAINNIAFTKKDNKIELNIKDAFKVSSINNKVELSMLNKSIANYEKNSESQLPDERNNSSVCDNNTLLISEETQKVYLPYTIEEVMRKLNNSNEYQTIEEVIENEYTLPLAMFKNPIVSRFKEAYMFMRVKEKSSVYAALDLAVELMFNSNLNPAIIRACKDLKELNIYLDCLYENEVEKFDCFKIVYKVLPKV